MTPFTCRKTAWIPQKHPPERTAVCLLGVEARGASYSGAGIAAAGLAIAGLRSTQRGSRQRGPDLACRQSPVQPQAAKRDIRCAESVFRVRCEPCPGRGARDGAQGCNRSGTGDWHPQPQRARLSHRYAARAPGRVATAIRHRQRTPRRARRRGAAWAGDRDLSCFPAGDCISFVPAAARGAAGIRGVNAPAGRLDPPGPRR